MFTEITFFPGLRPILELSSKTSTVQRIDNGDLKTLSTAWYSGLERRSHDDHDRKVNGSTPNLVSLLRPRIRCFMMIITVYLPGGIWQAANYRSQKKIQPENVETKATSKRVWIRPTHSASAAFS